MRIFGSFSTSEARKIFLKQNNDMLVLDYEQACIDASSASRFISVRPQNTFLFSKTLIPPLTAGLGRRFFMYVSPLEAYVNVSETK